jgi:uncharacterized protein (DUF2384 family)
MNKRIMKKKIRQLLLAELAMRFEGTEDAVQWLETPHPELRGQTPREAVAGGDAARVTLLLEQLGAATSAT